MTIVVPHLIRYKTQFISVAIINIININYFKVTCYNMEDRNESQTTNKQTKNNYPVHIKAEYFNLTHTVYCGVAEWQSWARI